MKMAMAKSLKRSSVWDLKTGTGVLVGGCYVIFIDWANSDTNPGRVLRVRGDLPERFSGWVDSIGVWRGSAGSFVCVELGEVVSVLQVPESKLSRQDVPAISR
jgi:hypothetical protein